MPLTIENFIWLPPLLVDKDDGDKDQDFCHYTQEGPERCQTAAYAQIHCSFTLAKRVGGTAVVVTRILLDVQLKNA